MIWVGPRRGKGLGSLDCEWVRAILGVRRLRRGRARIGRSSQRADEEHYAPTILRRHLSCEGGHEDLSSRPMAVGDPPKDLSVGQPPVEHGVSQVLGLICPVGCQWSISQPVCAVTDRTVPREEGSSFSEGLRGRRDRIGYLARLRGRDEGLVRGSSRGRRRRRGRRRARCLGIRGASIQCRHRGQRQKRGETASHRVPTLPQ